MSKLIKKGNILTLTPKNTSVRTKELQLAQEIQKYLLPQKFPLPHKIDVGSLYLPSKHIGGDFYDAITIDNRRAAFVIGDISGHSIPAALFMTQCISLIRAYLKMNFSLTKVLEATNDLLLETAKPDMFSSAFVGIYDSHFNHFTYVNAGHNPPILTRTSWNTPSTDFQPNMMLVAEGMALNCSKDFFLEEKKIQLYEGDILTLYTDGIVDVRSHQGDVFGETKIKECINMAKEQSAENIADHIFDSILEHTQDSPHDRDDMAVLILKIREDNT
ncbi:MAG: serine/threonine-protein phosphatase [Deltaproteobacteria bacterium]|nr:serine/threonine-protein phosphatase [Deltaproteobacteria bacterium]